jgi:two-component system, cell cycle sensor histidine kinase PleC
MRFQANENSHYAAGQSSKRWIAAFCVATIVAICALVIEAVVRERRSAFERASIEAANLSAGFEEQVRGTLNGLAGAMEFLKVHIEAEDEAFDLAAWKSRVPQLLAPAVLNLITDANGNIRATTAEYDGSPVSLADRDYFRAHRDNPDRGFFIGQPVIGKLLKRLVIPVSRRLETKDGRFAGVLEFSIDPEILTALHRQVNLGETSTINLFRSDGVTLARYTTAKGLDAPQVGVKAAPGLMAWSKAELAQFSGACPMDGITRLHSWRKVMGYPLFVVVALGEAEAFAAANHQAKVVIGLGITALSLLLIMMGILNREITRRVQHAIALDEETEKVREANAESIVARRIAEEASQAKSAFLANISHELRTPLNAILGFSEIIRDKILGNDADRHVDYAADIYQSGAHLLNIVNGILDVAKIEAGKLELHEEDVEVDNLLQECLLAVGRQASAGRLHLRVMTPDVRASIFGDRTKLKQIVINLLSNAVKFTPQGECVFVTAAAEKNCSLRLTVKDTGIGMSDEEIEHALKLFCQVDNCLSRRYEGTGLGLPLAVLLTELHGGTLRIESTPGSGTAVHIHFPAERISWNKENSHPGKAPGQRVFPFKIAS